MLPGVLSVILSLGVNRNLLAVLAQSLKLYYAVSLSEKRIVRALAYVLARVDVSSSLTNEDVAGQYELTVSSLDAESLGFGISAVLGRTHTFLMSEMLHGNN